MEGVGCRRPVRNAGRVAAETDEALTSTSNRYARGPRRNARPSSLWHADRSAGGYPRLVPGGSCGNRKKALDAQSPADLTPAAREGADPPRPGSLNAATGTMTTSRCRRMWSGSSAVTWNAESLRMASLGGPVRAVRARLACSLLVPGPRCLPLVQCPAHGGDRGPSHRSVPASMSIYTFIVSSSTTEGSHLAGRRVRRRHHGRGHLPGRHRARCQHHRRRAGMRAPAAVARVHAPGSWCRAMTPGRWRNGLMAVAFRSTARCASRPRTGPLVLRESPRTAFVPGSGPTSRT